MPPARTPRFPIVGWIERRTRAQRTLAVVLVGSYLLWRALRIAAGTILDRWWYAELTDASVWSTRVLAQAQVAVAAGILTAVTLGGSVFVVLRLSAQQPQDVNRFWQRYHDRMGPAHRWLLIAIAAFFTYRTAHAAAGEWQTWVLYRHGADLDVITPGLDTDLGDHLFKLPFLSTASAFVRQMLLFSGAVALFGHAASGSIRWPGGSRLSRHAALAHLAGLGAAFAAVQALDDVFVRRLALGTNRVGAFDGPGFTELRVVAPSLVVLAALTVLAGVAAVHFGRTRSWKPLAIIGTSVVVLQVVTLVVVPALTERFIVAPAEAARQLDSIDHNLQATRAAYGLADVITSERAVSDGIRADVPRPAPASLDRTPLFEQEQMAGPFQVMAGTTGTRITDVDLDRYEINGRRRPVLIAARSASRPDLPERGWVQEHLVYTHGNGVVVAPADAVDADGRPDVSVIDDAISPEHPELYFGEGLQDWYALVDTRRVQQSGARYEGTAGITMHSFLQRAVLALAVGEPEPLLSSELTGDTELLYRRDVTERVHALAPFLTVDADPYPVAVDDRVYWVVDAYTTSSTYPYSQFATTNGLPAASELSGKSFNYVRASVKVAIDAYDGSTHLYRTASAGANDPLLDVWTSVFPGLIQGIDELPEELATHLRYPKDLFTVQSELLGRYHVEDAELLFNGSQRDTVSAAAVQSVGDTTGGPSPAVNVFVAAGSGASEATSGDWVTVRTYGPGASTNPTSTRDELSAIAIGSHDDPERLEMVQLEPDTARQLSSPQVAQSAIDADPELAQAITLLNANGSKVQFGPMTPVLVGEGVVWLRSVIVSGTATAAIPRLYGVIAVSNGLVGFGPTVEAAVAATIR